MTKQALQYSGTDVVYSDDVKKIALTVNGDLLLILLNVPIFDYKSGSIILSETVERISTEDLKNFPECSGVITHPDKNRTVSVTLRLRVDLRNQLQSHSERYGMPLNKFTTLLINYAFKHLPKDEFMIELYK